MYDPAGQLDIVQENTVHRGRIIVVLAEANTKLVIVRQAPRCYSGVQIYIEGREPVGTQVPKVLNLVPGNAVGAYRHTVEAGIAGKRIYT